MKAAQRFAGEPGLEPASGLEVQKGCEDCVGHLQELSSSSGSGEDQ